MDLPPLTPPEHSVERRALGHRERFVAFAFAAADTLIEIGGDGTVSFATGATRARFGAAPERGSRPCWTRLPAARRRFGGR